MKNCIYGLLPPDHRVVFEIPPAGGAVFKNRPPTGRFFFFLIFFCFVGRKDLVVKKNYKLVPGKNRPVGGRFLGKKILIFFNFLKFFLKISSRLQRL
jgi:hypothetical protein